MLLTAGLLLAPALAAQDVEATAEATVGWSRYDDLWTGDLILGAFQLQSPSRPFDRLLISPRASVTYRPDRAHRLRLVINPRTLQRVSYLDHQLQTQTVWTSDGELLTDAWRERFFLDEASWRWRPDGDPSIDLRVGILPYSIAGGRLLHESWPGVRFRFDAMRRGILPVAALARIAVSPTGSAFGALTLQHEPSSFEFVGLEASMTVDSTVGIAPMFEDDFGMMLELWRTTSDGFFDENQVWAENALAEAYGNDMNGIWVFYEDLQTFMDLSGTARIAHVSALSRLLVKRWMIDAAVVGGLGQVTLTGKAIPPTVNREELSSEWPGNEFADSFELQFPVRGLAWDLAVDRLLGDHWRIAGFFQGMTGDPLLVEKATSGQPVNMFLATDHRFTRTRVFPVDVAARCGAWSAPAGVAGHGLASTGLSIGLSWPTVAASAQLALPMATHRSPIEPYGRIYGVEADLFVAVRPLSWLSFAGEAGAFKPGTFFLDDTSDDRDTLQELPIGWRVYAGVTVVTPS